MKDKRKIIFCFICLIIIVVSEFFLFKKAKSEDKIYKENMKLKLEPIATELIARGFEEKSSLKKNIIENGILEYERNTEDYACLEIHYDEFGKIENLKILLEYPENNYSDDIFSDVYYIFSIVGIDLYEEKYIEALNVLTDDTNNKKINSEISKNDIVINENKYTFTLKSVKDNNGIEKIQFCLE